eukprot:TRINITY_DN9513_c0_g3_i1.p1 TRINITY_DN9513_c0_g3~~TRINITY_DN9513_c0_g3_i1.p1  ORF type:complete len:433 (+),score=87.70 TRINITY_DN9513_c0_g3_i1:59-1357(+)
MTGRAQSLYALPVSAEQNKKDERLAYWIFLLLGVGILSPWNAFITAIDFFDEEYPDAQVSFSFALVYNLSALPLLYAVSRARSSRALPYDDFILWSYAIGLVVLVIVPSISYASLPTNVKLGFVMGGVFVTGVTTTLLFGSIFAVLGPLNPLYTQAVMTGSGFAGIVIATLRIITKLALSDDLLLSSVIYFAIAAFSLLLCIIGYRVLMGMQFILVSLNRISLAPETPKLGQPQHASGTLHVVANLDDSDESTALLISPKKVKMLQEPKIPYWIVFAKVWKLAALVFSSFTITLSLFPGLVAVVPSQYESLDDWFATINISIFLVFDFIGRSFPGYKILFRPNNVWIAVVARLIFFPLFILCYFEAFGSDIPMYITGALFAFTNGYCGSLIMMFGPDQAEPVERELAGSIMIFACQTGVFVGSCIGWLFLLL